jgi:WG containing repeat/Putative cell wall binding repeat
MTYKEIQLSFDQTHFLYEGKLLFGKFFTQALKFHSENLAAVQDETGWYHIDLQGVAKYKNRYTRAFGYYCNRATVVENQHWYHIDTDGKRFYEPNYIWCGNYQEHLCTVRDIQNHYFHLNVAGLPLYEEKYKYAGDFKDGFACVRLENGLFKHINPQGKDLNGQLFKDLGIFHKGIATAKDENGWFHINLHGNALYAARYALIEPFYNGFALVEDFQHQKKIISEQGEIQIRI